MKKLLSIVLALVLVLGVLTSCEFPFIGGTPNVEEADIQEVVKQLDEMYKDDNGASIPSGTELIARIKFSGTEFTITWTSDNKDIKIDLVDGLYVVTIPEDAESQSDYKLIATITSPGGQSATVEYTRVLTPSFGMITEPVIGGTYKLAVLHGYVGSVVYFRGEANKPSTPWYLGTTQDILSAVDMTLEAVNGVEGAFRLSFMKDGEKLYLRTYQRDGAGYENDGTIELTSVLPEEYYTYDSENNAIIWTNANGAKIYLGCSGTFDTIQASNFDKHFKGATSYPARFYGAGGIKEELPEQNLPTVPENYTSKDVVEALYKLQSGQTLEGPYEMTGVITSIKYAYDPAYNNVSVNIVVDGMTDKPVLAYRLNGGEELKVGDTITIFAGITNYNGTYETTSGGVIRNVVPGEGGGTVTPPVGNLTTAEEILNALYGLADNETLTGSFTLTGKITALDSYKNPTIVVEGFESKPVYCFKLVVDNAVGDTITVTATTMKNFGGTYEFMNCTLGSGSGTVTPPATGYSAPVAGTAYKLYMELPTGKVYFKGSLDAAKNSYLDTTTDLASAVEIFFETVDGGYNIYFMNGDVKTYINAEAYLKDPNAAGNVYAGCHFTLGTTATTTWTYDTTHGTLEVYGEIEGKSDTFFAGTYGTYTTISLSGVYYKDQIASGTQFPARLVLSDGTTPPAGDGEGSGTETPPATGSMTIADALKAPVGTSVVLTGTVSKVKEVWSSQFNNISVYLKDDAGNEILLYRLSTKVALGDVITVTGTIGVYGEDNQVAQGATAVINTAHTCEYADADCLNPSKCHCDKVLAGSVALGHTAPDADGCCTRCGSNITASYTSVKLSFADKANRTTFNSNQQVWEQNGIKLINDQGSSTSAVADYANPARFYKSSKITVEYENMAKIDFVCNTGDYANALKAAISGTGITVLVNGSTVTVQFDEPVDSFVIASLTGGQVRMNSLTVYTLAD